MKSPCKPATSVAREYGFGDGTRPLAAWLSYSRSPTLRRRPRVRGITRSESPCRRDRSIGRTPGPPLRRRSATARPVGNQHDHVVPWVGPPCEEPSSRDDVDCDSTATLAGALAG